MLTRQIKTYYVDSGQILTSNNNDFSVNNNVNLAQYTHVSLSKLSVPISYYQINTLVNSFILEEQGVQTTITIPSSDYGNLNYLSFATVMAAYLTNNSSQGFTYTISYRNDLSQVQNAKFTYTCSNPAATVKLIFDDTDMCQIFGFDADSTNEFSAGVLVSTNPFNFSPENTLFIHSDLVRSVENQGTFSQVLGTCFVSGNQIYTPFTYQNNDIVNTAKLLDNTTNQSWRFSITNELGAPIYFNNFNLSIELMFLEMVDVAHMWKDFFDRSIAFYKAVLLKLDRTALEEIVKVPPDGTE